MADELGDRIRQARLAKGLTLEKFAPMLEVSLRTLTRYESGESDLSVDMLIKVAAITEKPLSFFLGKVTA